MLPPFGVIGNHVDDMDRFDAEKALKKSLVIIIAVLSPGLIPCGPLLQICG